MAPSTPGFLYTALKVRPHELRGTALHFIYLLNVVGVIIIGRTVASALFLTTYEADALPWMYVASSGPSPTPSTTPGRPSASSA